MHPIKLKGLVVLYIFQRLIYIFKDDYTKFQDKRQFFQIPGVFQDQGQIQGLFQVWANPAKITHVSCVKIKHGEELLRKTQNNMSTCISVENR